MPGVIGLIGTGATAEAASLAATSISHFDSYCSKQVSPFDDVEIAQVWRNLTETADCWDKETVSGTSVFVNGKIIKPGIRPRHIGAAEILQNYLSDTLKPDKYDGSFLIVIADVRTRQLVVYNDRLGTLPCYYFSSSSCFCFAPEAKAIFSSLGLKPEYSISGLVTFLTLGYCLADTTLFSAIHFLEPGSRLVIDVPTASYEITRYWRMHYDPAHTIRSRRNAEDALYEAIIAGHRSVFANAEERYDLLLSGGWDSRGMLAAAHKLGYMPQRSISWGLRDDVPLSDPFLAAQLAEQYGVEHHFFSYDTDAFVEHATEWSYLTEVNTDNFTDNFGWHGEGTKLLLNEYASNVDFVMAGDECWGFGGHVRNRVEAMASCRMPASFPDSLAICFGPGLAADCSDIYSAEIDKVLRHCSNENPNDIKDFLYAHGRNARFIFPLAYYKELAAEVRRPFLCKDVLDVVQQLPTRFRYGKNLYISTLVRFFPELIKVDEDSTDGLPQWRRDLRKKPKLSRFFASLLSRQTLSQSSFSDFLNLQEVEKIVSQFFEAPPNDQSREIGPRARMGPRMQRVKQQLRAYDDIRLAAGLKKPATNSYKNYDLLRRIALLVLLDRNLSRFSTSK